MNVTAAELAHRTRRNGVLINPTMAAYFLGYWLEHRIVEEVVPGRYCLTEYGQRVSSGLLDVDEAAT